MKTERLLAFQLVAMLALLATIACLMMYSKSDKIHTIHDDDDGQLLLNWDFFQGRKYWRQFHWQSKYSVMTSARRRGGTERSVTIAPESLFPGTASGHFQYVSLSERNFDGAGSTAAGVAGGVKAAAAAAAVRDGMPRRKSSGSGAGGSSLTHYFTASAAARRLSGGDDFAKFEMIIDAKARDDDSYLYDQRVPFHYMFKGNETKRTRQWVEECVTVVTGRPLDYAMVYLLFTGTQGKVQIANATFRYDVMERRLPPHHCPLIESAVFEKHDTYAHSQPMQLGDGVAAAAAHAQVTIVTQLSLGRLDRLKSLNHLWDGPISAGVLVTNDEELAQLRDYLDPDDPATARVQFRVVYDPTGGPYPINVLRNFALADVHTEWVVLLDVDFMPNAGLSKQLSHFLDEKPRDKKTLYVLPSFDVDADAGMPEDKDLMLDLLKEKRARQIHVQFAPEAHRATDYERWTTASWPYAVQYENHYEPYFLCHKSIPKYDNRFKGYGWDKVSHVYELHLAQYRFEVLPDSFVVHMAHDEPAWKTKKESVMTRVWQNWYEFAFELQKKYSGSAAEPLRYKDMWNVDILDWPDYKGVIDTNDAGERVGGSSSLFPSLSTTEIGLLFFLGTLVTLLFVLFLGYRSLDARRRRSRDTGGGGGRPARREAAGGRSALLSE